jgi:SAM-dependent methyltransferase
MLHPLRLYDDGLLGGCETSDAITVRMSDGTVAPLALERYLGAADAVDELLLRSVAGPVLDLGCGPGRHLHALARRGVFALGVDLSPVAVSLARGGGARAIVASVFDELPGAGSWQTALLLDGNIGIGGAPERLLSRVAGLLSPDGEALVELDPPGVASGPVRACLQSAGGGTSAWFPWARLAWDDVELLAGVAGFVVAERWSAGDRWFARLRRIDRAPTVPMCDSRCAELAHI